MSEDLNVEIHFLIGIKDNMLCKCDRMVNMRTKMMAREQVVDFRDYPNIVGKSKSIRGICLLIGRVAKMFQERPWTSSTPKSRIRLMS